MFCWNACNGSWSKTIILEIISFFWRINDWVRWKEKFLVKVTAQEPYEWLHQFPSAQESTLAFAEISRDAERTHKSAAGYLRGFLFCLFVFYESVPCCLSCYFWPCASKESVANILDVVPGGAGMLCAASSTLDAGGSKRGLLQQKGFAFILQRWDWWHKWCLPLPLAHSWIYYEISCDWNYCVYLDECYPSENNDVSTMSATTAALILVSCWHLIHTSV